jgi:hypothetical protein
MVLNNQSFFFLNCLLGRMMALMFCQGLKGLIEK